MRRQGNWLFNFHKSFKWFMPANISKLFEIRNNFLQFWKLKYELLRIKFKFFTCHSIIPRQSESEIKFHQLIRSTIWFRFPFSIPTPCFLYQDNFFPLSCPVVSEKTHFNFGWQENFLTTQWSDFSDNIGRKQY